MERFGIIVNGFQLSAVTYYHKALHLGCCSSPRSASEPLFFIEIHVNLSQLVGRFIKCMFRISRFLSHFTLFILLTLRVMDQLILTIVKDFLKNQTLLIFWLLPLPSVTKIIETPIFSRKSPKKMLDLLKGT